jgi:hypothetical protein
MESGDGQMTASLFPSTSGEVALVEERTKTQVDISD